MIFILKLLLLILPLVTAVEGARMLAVMAEPRAPGQPEADPMHLERTQADGAWAVVRGVFARDDLRAPLRVVSLDGA